jgi:hypothetical protein
MIKIATNSRSRELLENDDNFRVQIIFRKLDDGRLQNHDPKADDFCCIHYVLWRESILQLKLVPPRPFAVLVRNLCHAEIS